MTTVLHETDEVRIPGWVVDLESFRRWADMEEFPETGRICYLNGEVWVDMTKEQLFSHNQVKSAFFFTLTGLVKVGKLGRFIPDGLRLSSVAADMSAVPDGSFFLAKSRRTGRVRLIPGKRGGFVELEGTPDMVLEVISDSSVNKDTVVLLEAYWEAGIREYWVVDARRDSLRFDIYLHSTKGYVAVRKHAGWVKSGVFGKSFRLTQETDENGDPEYTLAVR